MTAELPPFCYHRPPPTVSEFGEPRGLVYEVVREMARRIGHSGTVEFMGWSRAQEVALIEPNVGILALTRSPEREPFYNWMVDIVDDDLILVGGTGVDVSSLDKVRERPTGVLRTSGAEALLREQKFTRIEPASEEWVNAMKLRDRRIDAWLAPRLMVLFGWREIGGDASVLNIGQIVRPSPIYFAASRDVSEAEADRWRGAFAAAQGGRHLRPDPRLLPAAQGRADPGRNPPLRSHRVGILKPLRPERRRPSLRYALDQGAVAVPCGAGTGAAIPRDRG